MALLCYLATVVLQTRGHARAEKAARLLWLMGCLLSLAHVAAAFHFHHHWSHALAAEDTRRQTLEQTGVNFRGGIYFNYLFALVWLADCAGWLVGGKHFHETHRAWRIVLHSFFLFMIFNATVVFGHGWARPVGAVVCALAVAGLMRGHLAGNAIRKRR